jgi:hypothetical protein
MESNLSTAGYKTHVKTLEDYYDAYGLEAPKSEDGKEEGEGEGEDEEEEEEEGEDGEGSEGSADESEED